MQKNYAILAFVLCLACSTAFAQKIQPEQQGPAGKTATPSNSISKFDTVPPQMECGPNISANILPIGKVTLWATDFLISATDDITPSSQIRYGIREAGSGTGFPFSSFGVPQNHHNFPCDELGYHDLEIWAMDLAGNSSHCISGVTVMDNNHNCSGPPGLIKLQITSGPDENGIEEATIEVNGIDSLGIPFNFQLANNNGSITVPVGSSGTIRLWKDDNPLNGVSTYDVVIIGNHLNGSAPITNPYHLIAADVNRDSVLNAQDTLEIRRLIMGIDTEFQHNSSWRFVDKSYAFQSPDPLQEAYPEYVSFNNIQGNLEFHFEGIKVGDVNNTAVGNSFAPATDDDRRNGTVEPPTYNGTGRICVEQCDFSGVEEAELAIYKDSIYYFDMSDSQGCWDLPNGLPIDSSFTLAPHKDDNPLDGVGAYDMLLLSFHINGTLPFTEPWQFVAADANRDNVIDALDSIAFRNWILGISQDNAAWRFVRSDYVFPWPNPLSQPFPGTITVGELVDSVEVVFLAIKIGDLSMNCFPQSPISEPGKGSRLNARIFPNPTSGGTTLTVQLPHSEIVQLEIRDLSGRLVFEDQWQLPAGVQSLEIPEQALPSPGLYIWTLRVAEAVESGKVIRL